MNGKAINKLNRNNVGSITLETALVLPLFIFAILSLLSVMTILRFYVSLEQEMTNTGEQIAIYTMAAEGTGFEEYSGLFAQGYARTKVLSNYTDEDLENNGIANGRWGIVTYFSSVLEDDDIVDLVFHYRMKPKLNFFDYAGFSLTNRSRVRAWTGYECISNNSENEDRIVYVAENGTVYHLTETCTHLNLSISTVSFSEVDSLRNNGGGRYSCCEICGYEEQETVFITNEGDRYHSSLTCGGLRRTIRSIPVSQVGSMPVCSRCASQ